MHSTYLKESFNEPQEVHTAVRRAHRSMGSRPRLHGRTVSSFDTKEEATKGGVLKRAVGSDGGSVKIQKDNGRFQEERTYPGSKDPRRSRG